MPSPYTESALIEQPAIRLFTELGWQTTDAFDETFGPGGTLGRADSGEVVLRPRLLAALARLNPNLPAEAIPLAIEELTRERGALSPVNANREVYRLLKEGVKVPLRNADNEETVEVVRVVDWQSPANNDFLLVSQFWVTGEMYKRRADLIGFVNGLPFVFVELKATQRRLEDAFQHNLRDYKNTIPRLFWYNAFIILSNASQSRIGSLTSEWEHFSEWKKINSEGEQGIVSLETMLRGTCDPARLLDLVENFTLFDEAKGGLRKLVAKNHQVLGVNNAIDALRRMRENKGRLGVFWHTQGSGKSYSMVFFAQKILRRVAGNWTFLVVTDRTDLDTQIYKNFADAGAVTEPEERVRAASGAHLQQLLGEDHRYVFTLIQKFRTERGATYPVLSNRDDIIVMTDEAHRSQYDLFALNMRNALPRAAFIGFTGTPLMAGEEKTREVFGDYVSIYNFKQSVDDHATVPLYYENRIPELQLTNQNLNADMESLLDDAMLDDEQEHRLEREFAHEVHLITRDERLEKIAGDIVTHFVGRGFLGKAMVVSLDKATAVRMYDKVQKHWQEHLELLRAQANACRGSADADKLADLQARIAFMQSTDMAVVVSQAQNEIEDFQKKGLEIAKHRKRMVSEDLETKFKDPADPLRIVFVCAMWMTGFDVPSCSTIYLDKPMRNHTLMQTIARANRVFGQKNNGLIVDYIGVFRNLQRALAIYGAAGPGQRALEGETLHPELAEGPVNAKAALVRQLRQAVSEASAYCRERGVNLNELQVTEGLAFVRRADDAVELLIVNDEAKQRFLGLVAAVDRLYRAILPDPSANEYGPVRALFVLLAGKIRALTPAVDITSIMEAVDDLLDDSVAPTAYVIRAARDKPLDTSNVLDLSRIDFEALRALFAHSRKRTEAERLRGMINSKLGRMVRLNRTRMDFLAEFQRLIDDYNSGSRNVEDLYNQLLAFAQRLRDEEKRHVAENLSEEELAIFDLLTRPDVKLSQKEERAVKQVARALLEKLKQEKLVLDWRRKQQSQAAVRLCIEDELDRGLPSAYTPELYHQKCDRLYQHVYDSYYGQGRSLYTAA